MSAGKYSRIYRPHAATDRFIPLPRKLLCKGGGGELIMGTEMLFI